MYFMRVSSHICVLKGVCTFRYHYLDSLQTVAYYLSLTFREKYILFENVSSLSLAKDSRRSREG